MKSGNSVDSGESFREGRKLDSDEIKSVSNNGTTY